MPLISAATLSGVARRPNPKSMEVPVCLVAAYSFLNLSSRPTLLDAPAAAPPAPDGVGRLGCLGLPVFPYLAT